MTYTCPHCWQNQTDVLVRDSYYGLSKPGGWIEFSCPTCEFEIPVDLADRLGLFLSI